MKFSDFQTQVLKQAFPIDGPPENIDFRPYVISGLVDIQRWIRCFRYRHDEVIPACSTYWQAGTTVFTKPRGRILRVYTVEDRGDGYEWHRPVIYAPVTLHELREWVARFKTSWSASYFKAPDTEVKLPLGFSVPNRSSDAQCGRASKGVYAIDESAGRIIVAPWIQSYEAVVVEWQGIKREWRDSDTVTSDSDFIRLAQLWVDQEYGRKWATQDLGVRQLAYSEARADMMVTCEEETRNHGEPVTAADVEAVWFKYSEGPVTVEEIHAALSPETTARVSFVGDFGTGGSDAQEVAASVYEVNPPTSSKVTTGWFVALGDNVYSPTSVAAAFAPYADYIASGTIRIALGNHDLDAGDLGAQQFNYLGVEHPINGQGHSRWYELNVGPLAIFVINSGIDTAGNVVEPDGNWEGSIQAQEIQAAIVRSTAKWKVAAVHHPPWTSNSVHAARTELRWVSDLPVHAVLAAHSHNYERGTFRNRLHIVAGTGGKDLYPFNLVPEEGSAVRLMSFGALLATVDAEGLLFEFRNVAGEVLDSVRLAEGSTPAIPPPAVYPIYYGRSAKDSGYVEADFSAFDALTASTRGVPLSFGSGSGYLVIAIPTAFGAPADTGLGEGFTSNGAPLPMAKPDSAPPFGTLLYGYGVETVTISGVVCRVYRTAQPIATSALIQIV